MGIDLNGAQMLLRARQNGVSFTRLATLGRQGLHANRPELISILRRSGFGLTPKQETEFLDPATIHAEAFFQLLGAEEITAIDASPYEGARIIHDMNYPIPAELNSAFDVVLDAGTLEHVFNFPTSIRNALQMVTMNGKFMSLTITNNFSGHGFYQFSPELFYRVLCGQNGYEMNACVMWEEINGSPFYSIPDPATLGHRIELTSKSGTYLFIQAARIGELNQEYIPYQSDYVRHWRTSGETAQSQAGRGLRSFLRGIRPLKAGIVAARDLKNQPPFRALVAEAEYKHRLLNRNRLRCLTPLENLTVRL